MEENKFLLNCSAKKRAESLRPLIEFGKWHAFAVAVRGAHVAGAEDDDFFGDASDACGLGAEADAGLLAMKRGGEMIGQR